MKNVMLAVLVLFCCYKNRTCEAQSCLANESLIQNWADTTPAGSDGLVHTTYEFVDAQGNAATPDPNVATAFSAAVSAWNGYSSTTGVQFSIAPPGDMGDVQVQLSTDASGGTGGCAAYTPATSRLKYGETFMQAVQSVATGTLIFTHELGHALGLADGGFTPSPPSIMNNPSNNAPANCITPQVQTSQLQASDAAGVKSCVALGKILYGQLLARSKAKLTVGSPFTTLQTYSPSCTYTYGTEYFYVDGELDSTEPYISGVVCQ